MPYSVRCKACSTTFAIPDEIWNKRVKGHVATLKCRSCKAEIEVDGTKPSVSQFPSTPPSAPANGIPSSVTATAPKDVTPKDVTPKDVTPKDVAPKDVAPKDVAPKDVAPKDVAPKDVAPKDVAPKDVAPKDAAKAESRVLRTFEASSAASASGAAKAPQTAAPAASSAATQIATPAASSSATQVASAATSASASKSSPLSVSASNVANAAVSAAVDAVREAKGPAPAANAKLPSVAQGPVAKSAEELAAADTGWSIAPPPAELARVGLGLPRAEASKTPKANDPADVGWSLAPPPAQLVPIGLGSSAEAATGRRTQDVAAQTVDSATSPVTEAQNAPAPAAKARAAVEVNPSPDVVSSVPQIEPVPEPDLSDLWVVSYGDDDDRELTEEQIAAELAAGKITTTTIVWHDGMPEWLPISGIPALSKYAPQPKPMLVRQAKSSTLAKSSPRASSSTTSTTPKLPTPTTGKASPAHTSSTAARSSMQKPDSPPLPPSAVPRMPPRIAEEAPKVQAVEPAAPTESAAKQPPPLPKSTAGGAADAQPAAVRDPKVLDDEVTVIYRPSLKSTGGHPPALPRRERPQSPAASPWEAVPTDEVVTSAPRVAPLDLDPAPSSPTSAVAEPSVQLPGSAPGFPAPSAVPRQLERGVPRGVPSTRPSALKSSPPPKPVETATSTVTHSEAASNVNTQLINDAEFLAMQRRLPKWAVPAAVVGAVVLIGLLIWAFSSGEEQPTIPIASVVVPTTPAPTERRSDAPNQPEVRAPTPANNATTPTPANSDEKDFARLFAQSVAKATGRFDPKAAERIASTAIDAAARCRHAPEPAGQARAVVTFATSGQVLSVQMGAPYINSPTGKCIETALGAIKLPPFQGQPGRLSLTVPIR